jgi:hypothetical protein
LITIMWVLSLQCSSPPFLVLTYSFTSSLIYWFLYFQVSLFFTETPTNPFLRCIDIELVSKMCHSKGALLCIDSTFASPINQKALTLGADIVVHSATKYIAGHNDVSWRGKFPILYLQIKICISWDYFVFKVIGGCISGRDELVSKVRIYHHVVGGVLNPVSWIGAISKCFLNLFAFTRVAYKIFCQISSYIMSNFWLSLYQPAWYVSTHTTNYSESKSLCSINCSCIILHRIRIYSAFHDFF